MTNTLKPGDSLQRFFGRSTQTCVSPSWKTLCIKEYGEVPGTVPLDFTEYDVTWIASKLSSVKGALLAEAIDMKIGSFASGVRQRS